MPWHEHHLEEGNHSYLWISATVAPWNGKCGLTATVRPSQSVGTEDNKKAIHIDRLQALPLSLFFGCQYHGILHC